MQVLAPDTYLILFLCSHHKLVHLVEGKGDGLKGQEDETLQRQQSDKRGLSQGQKQ